MKHWGLNVKDSNSNSNPCHIKPQEDEIVMDFVYCVTRHVHLCVAKRARNGFSAIKHASKRHEMKMSAQSHGHITIKRSSVIQSQCTGT